MQSIFAKLPSILTLGAVLGGGGVLLVVAADPPANSTKPVDSTKPADSTKSDEPKETAKVIPNRNVQNKTSKDKKKMADEPEYNKLNPEERWVILNKGTEFAFTGKYTDHFVEGTANDATPPSTSPMTNSTAVADGPPSMMRSRTLSNE